MSKSDVPRPPSLNALVRAKAGLPPMTMAEELAEHFEARLRANGGKWVPLSAEELAQEVPPPPDANAAIRAADARRRVEQEQQRRGK